MLALVPDEAAAAAFRAAAAVQVPAEVLLGRWPDLVRRAVDQAERLRLYAAAEANNNAVLLLKPYDGSWTSLRPQRQKGAKEAEPVGRGLHAAAGGPFFPDYVT